MYISTEDKVARTAEAKGKKTEVSNTERSAY
jgi:hypothetical protein